MSDRETAVAVILAHTLISEADALAFVVGHRISAGAPTMDPKAQIGGEFGEIVVAVDYRLAPKHNFPAPVDVV